MNLSLIHSIAKLNKKLLIISPCPKFSYYFNMKKNYITLCIIKFGCVSLPILLRLNKRKLI